MHPPPCVHFPICVQALRTKVYRVRSCVVHSQKWLCPLAVTHRGQHQTDSPLADPGFLGGHVCSLSGEPFSFIMFIFSNFAFSWVPASNLWAILMTYKQLVKSIVPSRSVHICHSSTGCWVLCEAGYSVRKESQSWGQGQEQSREIEVVAICPAGKCSVTACDTVSGGLSIKMRDCRHRDAHHSKQLVCKMLGFYPPKCVYG